MLFMRHSPHKKQLLNIVAGLLFVGIVVLAVSIATDRGDSLVITQSEFATTDAGSRVVRGTVENMTTRAFDEVFVDIELLDAEGTVIGSASAATAGLVGRQMWDFEALVAEENAADFRVRVRSS